METNHKILINNKAITKIKTIVILIKIMDKITAISTNQIIKADPKRKGKGKVKIMGNHKLTDKDKD